MSRWPSVDERFWSKVAGGDVEVCWEWMGYRSRDGYGTFGVGQGKVRAHRWAYEALRAPIPDGLLIDHLCRNRACVNPWHLEPVTAAVNSQRGEVGLHARHKARAAAACGKGHRWTPENTYVIPSTGRRACRECARIRESRRTRRQAEIARKAARAVQRAALRCSVDGCGRDYSSKGYCAMHAERVRRHGDPGGVEAIKLYRRAA